MSRRRIGVLAVQGAFAEHASRLRRLGCDAVGPGVETLVSLDGEPVAVRFGNQVGCCFHPELASDDALYRAALLS